MWHTSSRLHQHGNPGDQQAASSYIIHRHSFMNSFSSNCSAFSTHLIQSTPIHSCGRPWHDSNRFRQTRLCRTPASSRSTCFDCVYAWEVICFRHIRSHLRRPAFSATEPTAAQPSARSETDSLSQTSADDRRPNLPGDILCGAVLAVCDSWIANASQWH